MEEEYTVVLLKPDALARGLVGEIISRFEKVGLRLIACKLVKVPRKLAYSHYGYSKDWFRKVGEKLLEFYGQHGRDPKEEIGTMDPEEIGRLVQKWNVDYLTEGPVLAMIWQGPHAVEVVRKIVGPTYPHQAPPGTIRGDFGLESPQIANSQKRAIRNLIHASGSKKEAHFERQLWFKEKEIIKSISR